jgi:hypothetical protein
MDLRDEDLVNEHDPECRTLRGLLKAMIRDYPDFDVREIVTLVYWTLP